jgi:hypothetical protein
MSCSDIAGVWKKIIEEKKNNYHPNKLNKPLTIVKMIFYSYYSTHLFIRDLLY